jgi:hypothetical protein
MFEDGYPTTSIRSIKCERLKSIVYKRLAVRVFTRFLIIILYRNAGGLTHALYSQEKAALRLWAFHWFGASASAYGTWDWSLGGDVELCAVQVIIYLWTM